MIELEQSELELTGDTVTVGYVADPSIGHGQFRLENHGVSSVFASVETAWLQFGEGRRTLEGITVYDLGQECPVVPQGFKIEAKSILIFLVGFPAIVHEPRFGESCSVGLRLRINGNELQALSSIQFVRRFPRPEPLE